MKTMPHFYSSGKPVPDIYRENNKMEGVVCAKDLTVKLEFNEIFRQDSSAFFMKINTDLMEDEGIFKNDIVVIDPQEACINGKIIVGIVNGNIMVRRYEKIKSGLILYGDSKKISPLKIEEGYDQFKILGVVAYVIKTL